MRKQGRRRMRGRNAERGIRSRQSCLSGQAGRGTRGLGRRRRRRRRLGGLGGSAARGIGRSELAGSMCLHWCGRMGKVVVVLPLLRVGKLGGSSRLFTVKLSVNLCFSSFVSFFSPDLSFLKNRKIGNTLDHSNNVVYKSVCSFGIWNNNCPVD